MSACSSCMLCESLPVLTGSPEMPTEACGNGVSPAAHAQVQRELVGAGAVASGALSQKFLAMLLAMQDVPAVLIGARCEAC